LIHALAPVYELELPEEYRNKSVKNLIPGDEVLLNNTINTN